MGIFDGVFNNQPQVDAAQAQIGGINQGYNQLSQLFDLGRGALTSNIGQGNTVLNQGATQGVNRIDTATGGANAALASNFGRGADALTSNYYAGISPFLQNYATAQRGSGVLADALGLNGPQGNQRAIDAFKANPSYQFGLQQGEDAIAAQAQKAGMGASGNALNAADQFAQNYANQNWGNYLDRLTPYLNLLTPSAGGVQSGFTGLGQGLNTNAMNLGTGTSGNIMQGSGLSNADIMAWMSGQNQNYGTLGQGLNQSFTTQGNAVYGADTSKGNAQANADLAQAGVNANLLNTAGQATKAIFGYLSDETMKDEIEQVGELYDGQPVVRYRVKGDPRHQIGLIAQQVEEVNPDAVIQFTPHVKGVDYKRATDRAAEIFRMMEAA